MARPRVVRAEEAARGVPLFAPGVSAASRRRVAREELEARLAAERLLAEARTRAESLVAEARECARESAAIMAREAEAEAHARGAADWLAALEAQRRHLDREQERMIAIAVALAERLLGAALELDPAKVIHLAQAVLAEASSARRAVIDAHPLDARALHGHLSTAGLKLDSVEVREDAALARGELRLHTDVGTIDARLALRFERLAAALRDALR